MYGYFEKKDKQVIVSKEMLTNIGRANNRKNTKGRRTQYIKYWAIVGGERKQMVKCIKHKSK